MIAQLRNQGIHPRLAVRKAGARLGRSATVLVAAACCLLGLAAVPAFATTSPISPGGPVGPTTAPVTVTRLVTVGGTPGWQIALIAIGAALVAAAAAVILDRTLASRRVLAVPAS